VTKYGPHHSDELRDGLVRVVARVDAIESRLGAMEGETNEEPPASDAVLESIATWSAAVDSAVARRRPEAEPTAEDIAQIIRSVAANRAWGKR
jgi:hypothetical protein